jgi:hypothetical protein
MVKILPTLQLVYLIFFDSHLLFHRFQLILQISNDFL